MSGKQPPAAAPPQKIKILVKAPPKPPTAQPANQEQQTPKSQPVPPQATPSPSKALPAPSAQPASPGTTAPSATLPSKAVPSPSPVDRQTPKSQPVPPQATPSPAKSLPATVAQTATPGNALQSSASSALPSRTVPTLPTTVTTASPNQKESAPVDRPDQAKATAMIVTAITVTPVAAANVTTKSMAGHKREREPDSEDAVPPGHNPPMAMIRPADAHLAADESRFEDDEDYEIVTEKIYIKIPTFDHFINLGYDSHLDMVQDRIRFADLDTATPKMLFMKEGSRSAATDGNFYIDGERKIKLLPTISSTAASSSPAPLAQTTFRKYTNVAGDAPVVAAFIGEWEGGERRALGLTNMVVCKLSRGEAADGHNDLADDDNSVASPTAATIPSVFRAGGVTSKKAAAPRDKNRAKMGSKLFRQLTTGRGATAETAGWSIEGLVPVKSSLTMKRVL